MVEKTIAAVLLEPRKIELREFALPEVDADSGIAKVEITGVCGADWPIYTGALAAYAKTPLIPGHEIVARITKLGARAAKRWNVKEGDRIVMEEYAPCGRCEYCLSGRYYICNGMKMEKMYGFTSLNVAPGLWGGYSEYVYLDPQALIQPVKKAKKAAAKKVKKPARKPAKKAKKAPAKKPKKAAKAKKTAKKKARRR